MLAHALPDIPESASGQQAAAQVHRDAPEPNSHGLGALAEAHAAQVEALNSALSECWTLCTTLASLSSERRSIVFARYGNGNAQEQAWGACWKLCQHLYDTREAAHPDLVLPTLEMCRSFCQSLFEARQRQDEASDSVLRVLLELNTHLGNTQDRALPIIFHERTLEFYVTLCHRLMKQRTSLPYETDTLLRACWTLAELLYNVRQSSSDGEPADEELLGSAVQACWELSDLFREGWSHIRPGTDRGSSRSVHSTIPPSRSSARSQSGFSPRSSPSMPVSTLSRAHQDPRPFPPETPTTIFDDSTEFPLDSPEHSQVPNILVLGPDHSSGGAFAPHSSEWPSSASSVSDISGSSRRTASATTAPHMSAVALNLARVRVLILQAAAKMGFQITWSAPRSDLDESAWDVQSHAQSGALRGFVHALSKDAFGARQQKLLERYRRLVNAWPSVVRSGALSTRTPSKLSSSETISDTPAGMPSLVVVAPPSRIRATPVEVANAVRWMMRSDSNVYLADLFRFVHGYVLEDATDGVGVPAAG